MLIQNCACAKVNSGSFLKFCQGCTEEIGVLFVISENVAKVGQTQTS
jgi:hypothetical protein